MKRVILGVFLIQVLIIAFVGIPASGAANAIWRDPQSGMVVSQDTPENALLSFYQLVEKNNYQAAVQIFSKEDQVNMNGDLLQAYFQSTGLDKARLVRVFASPVVGENAVAASIRMVDTGEKGLQPMISFHTLKLSGNRWELIQQLDQSDIGRVKLVFERALDVADLILKDSLPGLSNEQKQFVYSQTAAGRQMMESSLQQINQLK